MPVTVENKQCVLSSDTRGNVTVVGVVDLETEVPAPLQWFVQPMLNDGEGNYYPLSDVAPRTLLDAPALATLASGEFRRQTVSRLTDEQLAELGVVRDP